MSELDYTQFYHDNNARGANDGPVRESPGARFAEVSFTDVMERYDPIEVTDDGVVLVAEPIDPGAKQLATLPEGAGASVAPWRPATAELGSSLPSGYSSLAREEYNSELRGKMGLEKYYRMRSDASVRSSLRVMKTPILGATWFMQPFDDTPEFKHQADILGRNLFKWMTYNWTQVMWDALLMLDFGYFMFEKVYAWKEFQGQTYLVFQKLAPRHPMDIWEWVYDANGGPRGVWFYAPPGSPDAVWIPIEKLLVFTFEGDAGNIEGHSVLRSAYKHWFFAENLYKIDAIQKERHGIGIPIIKLPPGFTTTDKALAHELGRNLRTNEKAHVVLPPVWEIMFAKLEGQPVSALDSVRFHREQIFLNVLGTAALADTAGDAKVMLELFYKSTRYVANTIANVVNQYALAELAHANWGVQRCEAPTLQARKLGDTGESRTVSFALRNLVGAGIIRPDDNLEQWSREIIDAPHAEPSTQREVATPQSPRVGPPRQSTAPAQRIGGGGNAGRDASGGTE